MLPGCCRQGSRARVGPQTKVLLARTRVEIHRTSPMLPRALPYLWAEELRTPYSHLSVTRHARLWTSCPPEGFRGRRMDFGLCTREHGRADTGRTVGNRLHLFRGEAFLPIINPAQNCVRAISE